MRGTHSSSSRLFIAVTLVLSLGGCGADQIADGERSTGEIVGVFSPNFSRSEIGIMDSGCTATLVDPRFVLTAAHCLNGATGPIAEGFTMLSTSGVKLPRVPIDLGFSLFLDSTTADGRDVGFARLTTPVSSGAAVPAVIASGLPTSGQQVTAFGFGCTDRRTMSDSGVKRAKTYTFFPTATAIGCPGDSGGPRVFGPANGTGAIWGLTVGANAWGGEDIVADAVWTAAPGLRAVRAFSNTNVTNGWQPDIPWLGAQGGVKVVTGFFNNDGFTDIALVGGSGWSTIPIAFSTGNGDFTFDNVPVGDGFPGFATQARNAVAADFDRNGLTDIALLGGAGWGTIPIAFRQFNGSFVVKNMPTASLPGWSQNPGAYALSGDFNADGFGDIALIGGRGWSTVPVGLGTGIGTFVVSNTPSQLASWAQQSGAKALTGDFDADGDTDIVLTGGAGWNTIPLGRSDRAGGFVITNSVVSNFPFWATRASVKFAAGDFDGDGDADIAVAGASDWVSVGFAFSRRDGNFDPANMPINFPGMPFALWSTQAGIMLSGQVNGDANADLMLTAQSSWGTIPVAFLRP